MAVGIISPLISASNYANLPCVVNLLKANIKQFMESGAILGAGEGLYWLACGLREAEKPYSGPVFWSQDFFGEPKAYQGQTFFTATKEELLSALSEFGEVSKPSLEFQINDGSVFKEFFNKSKSLIDQGFLSKIVPYSFFKSEFQMSDSAKVFFLRNLMRFSETAAGHLYGFWQKGAGFLGCTPEVLFEKNNGKICTMALAGTRPINDNPEALLKDPKEMAEHKFVITGIKEKLQSMGEVVVGDTEIKKLPRMAHLYTEIFLKNSTASYLELVSQLHPTPALGGSPSKNAWEILLGFDQTLPRGHFGAPFGCEISGGSAVSVVAIRGFSWNQRFLQIGAGCGVVRESIFENEWREVQLKFKSILHSMGLYE